jgi:14-3-3 protein epsilon
MSDFKLDITKFNVSSKSEARNSFQGLAHIAELAERHDDMCAFMREVVKAVEGNKDLSFDERNLLSVAYKNAVGGRRAAWRVLSIDENQSPPAARFRQHVERELEALCKDILELLETYLIPHPQANDEAKVFYQKMAGDYYRYLAEFIVTDELPTLQRRSGDYYKAAMDTATAIMDPTDPVRLGLALNYSVCLYEIIKDRDAACKLASEAFDMAILRLDQLDEQQYKDGTLILQLLRDNLTLWTSPDNEANDEQDE